MPTFREPYEDLFDIGYIRQPWGVDRVLRLEVKPHRRWELRMLAQGVALLYNGYARRHARGDVKGRTETPASELPIRPVWQANPVKADRYDGKYDGAGIMFAMEG